MAEHKPMTDAELAEMRAYTPPVPSESLELGPGGDNVRDADGWLADFRSEEYAEFFRRTRIDMPRLLDEVEWLRRALNECRRAHDAAGTE